MTLALAFLIGIVAGLRSMIAPAAVSWAAVLGWIDLSATPLAFLGSRWTAWVFTALVCLELVTDQLPGTPSRKVPIQFGGRLISGALSGGALGAASGALFGGVLAGIIGAAVGSYGGAAARAWLAARFGSDRPAALIEDVVAVVAALAIVNVG